MDDSAFASVVEAAGSAGVSLEIRFGGYVEKKWAGIHNRSNFKRSPRQSHVHHSPDFDH